MHEQISMKAKIMKHYTLVAVVEPKLFFSPRFLIQCEKVYIYTHIYIWIGQTRNKTFFIKQRVYLYLKDIVLYPSMSCFIIYKSTIVSYGHI